MSSLSFESLEHRHLLSATAFAPRSLTTDFNVGSLQELVAADFDGDRDVDLVAANKGHSKVHWYANQGGHSFQQVQELDLEWLLHPPIAIDLDGDNDLDIVGESSQGLVWLKNTDGRGAFGTPTLIRGSGHGGASFAGIIANADVDDDGDQDVIASFEGRLTWFENDGVGGFPQTHEIGFAGSEGDRALLLPNDLDKDGDVDLLVVESVLGLVLVRLFRQTEPGGFAEAETIRSVWYFDAFALHYLDDIDSDGDDDLLSVINHEADFGDLSDPPNANGFQWLENNEGHFALEPHRVETPGRVSPFSADVDLDGDVDVMVMTSEGAMWYENISGLISSAPISVAEYAPARSLPVDMDGDRDVDLLLITSEGMSWYENRLAGDVNDDGHVDVRDFLRLSAHFGKQDDALWSDGDLNADLRVDVSDFLVLSRNFGRRRT